MSYFIEMKNNRQFFSDLEILTRLLHLRGRLLGISLPVHIIYRI
ncbi:hypothetical protein BAOM_3315 [Peribacillus asahii]|uniref:Uncharacterized protein n=1 Tax=Peribacillus asahii TaxID=228899 RepID=A0A3Q9RQC9_9BACI|nr:hypothetical protein BAOM_3315 [Peribacillus asahii]